MGLCCSQRRMARLQIRSMVLLLLAGGVLVAAHERHRWRQTLSPLWVQTDHDIPYGPRSENRLDILQRRWVDAQVDRPGVIVFHGGGWASGSREDVLVRVCHQYLEHGFLVANVDYRKGSIAAAVQDAVLALQWFTGHAPAYGVDRDRIVVTGESAGAHLALMAAFQSGERTAAVVNFYGVSDLTLLMDRPAVRAVLPPEDPERAARALSPVTHVRRGLPPVFSIHGTADGIVPMEQTALLARAIKRAGGEAFELYIEGGAHGFSMDRLQATYSRVFEFLQNRRIAER